MAFPVPNHRAAFLAYAAGYGLALEETPQTVRVLVGRKEVLKAKFDRRDRLIKLTGLFGPTR
jgi:hypothetical protein